MRQPQGSEVSQARQILPRSITPPHYPFRPMTAYSTPGESSVAVSLVPSVNLTVIKKGVSVVYESGRSDVYPQSEPSPASPSSRREPGELQFESRFESGNLQRVQLVTQGQEYNLVLQKDTNSNGFCQWFFFRVGNCVKGQRVRFNIVNLYKRKSLYQQGMRVMACSRHLQRTEGRDWFRGGQNITYSRTAQNSRHYSLSWDFVFVQTNDLVHFAYAVPYTYSDLSMLLQELERQHPRHCRRKGLCRTLAGNRVDLLLISDRVRDDSKQSIVITARCHPAETVGSYMVKGLLQFLLGDSAQADYLRKRFVFKVVPMLNPDGVIVGNSRCSLSGADLNRRFYSSNKKLHPEVIGLKRLFQNTEVALFFDLHGHSQNQGLFTYGNFDQTRPGVTKKIAAIFTKVCPQFRMDNCSFANEKQKEGTARSYFFSAMQIVHSYTLEASFCGNSTHHFTVRQYQQFGQDLCRTIHRYHYEPPPDRIVQSEEEESAEGSEQDYAVDLLPDEKIHQIFKIHRERQRIRSQVAESQSIEVVNFQSIVNTSLERPKGRLPTKKNFYQRTVRTGMRGEGLVPKVIRLDQNLKRLNNEKKDDRLKIIDYRFIRSMQHQQRADILSLFPRRQFAINFVEPKLINPRVPRPHATQGKATKVGWAERAGRGRTRTEKAPAEQQDSSMQRQLFSNCKMSIFTQGYFERHYKGRHTFDQSTRLKTFCQFNRSATYGKEK